MMYVISEQCADDIDTYHFLNIRFDLLFEKCYPFHTKTTVFCFTLVLVIANPKIFD